MNKLRKYFFSGLIALLPIALSSYVFIFCLSFMEGLSVQYVEPFLRNKIGFYFKGISIVITLIVIIILGFITSNFIGKKVLNFFENLLIKLPIFKQIYPALKDMALFLFSREGKEKFDQVVFIQYPRKELYSLGFLMNKKIKINEKNEKICSVFIPSAPGPFTGFIVMIAYDEIILSEITVEQAFKFIVSGGVVNFNQTIDKV